jgi:AraC-like DNA-binding protein
MKIELPNKNIQPLSYFNYVQKEPKFKHEALLDTNTLILVRKGTKILHLKNKDLLVDKEHLLFLKSGSYVMSEVLDEYYEAMLFLYDDSLLLDFISKYNITFDDVIIDNSEVVCLNKTSELKMIMDASYNYLKNNNIEKSEIIKLKLEEAFLNILNSSLSSEFRALLFSVYTSNYFKLTVEKNFSYEDNILDLAHELKMTSLAFREKFKEVYQITPKKWQTLKRLEKAKILLENSDKNVSEVCMDCGFDNLSWFIQVFKKQYNLTPKQIKTNKN